MITVSPKCSAAAVIPAKSAAQIVFEKCLSDMRAAFYSFMKAKSQYDAEMDEVSKVSDEIDLGLDGKAKDVKIADFADKKRRADQLRAIKDFKFEQLMKVMKYLVVIKRHKIWGRLKS
eukprot:COSAG02_NODE_217_length_28595_cov_19.642371_8_plen_118_part_00